MAANISSGYRMKKMARSAASTLRRFVDVTLVLLIVFMITVPVIVGSARVKVDVPETTSVEAEPRNRLPLMFSLKRNDAGKAVLYLNDNPTDEAARAQNVRRKPSQGRPAGFVFGRQSDRYGEVMNVVDMLESLGLKKLMLDTRHVEQR